MKGKRTAERERKKGVSNKLLIILLIVVIIIVAVLLVMKILNDRKTEDVQNENIANEIEVVELQPEPEPQIVAGTDRPIAVMIDNHESAWPQAGLNDAYIVYEIIVEGGETRLMPIFKGKSLEKIGPIRSARHYFLDYAMENDAIYVHYGQSPQAESDISSFDIDNINGLVQSSSDFWRDKGKYAPHNAVSSTEKILKIANQKEYRTSSDAESVLNYVAKEFDLENGETATDVKIPVSTLQKVEYKYDPILCMNVPVEKLKVKTTDGKYSKIFDDYPAYVEMVKERLTNTKYKSDSDFYNDYYNNYYDYDYDDDYDDYDWNQLMKEYEIDFENDYNWDI